MKKLLAFILFTSHFSLFTVEAQERRTLDSLQNELNKFEALKTANSKKPTAHGHLMDSIKASILDGLSLEYMDNSPDTALNYAAQELSLSEETGYNKGAGNAWNNMALILYKKGNYAQA